MLELFFPTWTVLSYHNLLTNATYSEHDLWEIEIRESLDITQHKMPKGPIVTQMA